MPGKAPAKVRLGPGTLYAAPVATAEPSDLVTALNAAWVDLGYTADGHVFSASPSFEKVEVAEEIDPISWEPTGREMKVSFALSQMATKNLSLALNGGTVAVSGLATTFEPPDPGSEVRTALLWQAKDNKERWIFRKCIQTGDVEINRQKAPNNATIPVEFSLEIVVGGVKPFKAILETATLEA